MSVVDRYRKWLSNFPKEPADRMAMALATIDAYEACDQAVAEANLRLLVIAASSPHKLVFETGCNLLVRLAIRHFEAQQCILQMARDKNGTARFHAVAYLEEELPESLRREIVQIALSDRSAKVRQKAVERAEEFKFKELLPQLVEMQRSETNERVKESLAMHVPILRDGFRLDRSEDGTGYYLTVRGPRSFGGPFIPNERYSKEFVRLEVARIQSAQP